ncbi:MAG: class II aldolase/adducin family protein [Anaerolineales bacterium]|nr:class II aldolase/adducin family protein [Anaerolineales bacterium]
MNHIRFSSLATEYDLRLAIVACGRIAYERHLLTANDGNLSVRLGEERLLITPSGVCKGRLDPYDLLVLDLEGNVLKVHPRRKLEPTSETPMHLEVYRQRADVGAILHAHPVFATALTVAGQSFPVDVLPEVLLALGDVPITAYATPSSSEDADVIRDLIRDHDALLLRQHGSLTVGPDLETALTHLERIEHVAEVFWRAQMLGHVERIPTEALDRLKQVRAVLFANK